MTNKNSDKDNKNAQIISILNQKGGVGKSTTAINLSVALKTKGYKVLLIDLDPQGNSTSGLGIEKNDVDECIYDVLINETPLEEVIRETKEGVFVVPATIQLAGAEIELVSALARETKLKTRLQELTQDHDYIFIDCPPSLGLLTINALVASDSVLIPIQCEYYALEGVSKLMESIKMVKNYLNEKIEIFGIVLTMYDKRTALSKQVAEEVRAYFKDKVFNTVIPRSIKLAEAPSYGMSGISYASLNKGSQAYKDLAKEVIKRG